MFAPRAGSSRGLVVAEPAAATRTSLFGLPCILTQINIDCIKKACFPLFLFVITTENATLAKPGNVSEKHHLYSSWAFIA